MTAEDRHNDADIELIVTENRPSGAMDCPDIRIDPEVDKQIQTFAKTDTGKELGGVLLGELIADSVIPQVRIKAAIEAKHTEAVQTSVKFTHDTWDDINRVKDEKYPDMRIVGWFHTHPGFGIFLSRWDMFIQENFFNLPWQVAYVVDPVGKTSGFFRWENGKVAQVGKKKEIAPPIEVTLPKVEKVGRSFNWGTVFSVVLNVALIAAVVYLGLFKPPEVRVEEKIVTEEAPVNVERQSTTEMTEQAQTWTEYVVQRGDSFWSIAKNCYGEGELYTAIQLFNNMPDKKVLHTGERLRLPSKEIAVTMLGKRIRPGID
jgi:proteasome lid subunit RPN8/RPN11